MSDKDRIAAELARRHYSLEPEIRGIFRITNDADSDPEEPIKLLEINTATISAGLVPITFGADPDQGIIFPSTIIEITPDEYGMIKNKDLRLPDGWTIGDEIPRGQ